jgi:hypothetical protein
MHSTGFVVCVPQPWHALLLIVMAIRKNEHVKIQVSDEVCASGSASQHLQAAPLQR